MAGLLEFHKGIQFIEETKSEPHDYNQSATFLQASERNSSMQLVEEPILIKINADSNFGPATSADESIQQFIIDLEPRQNGPDAN